MSIPGPPALLWTGELLGFAGLVLLAGEGIRSPLGRWVPFFRMGELFERLLLDLYLGGAALYVVAAVPFGFSPVPLGVVLVLALGSSGFELARAARNRSLGRSVRALFAPLARPFPLLALGVAVGLGGIELAVASPIPTGNTFDSSVDALFVTLLNSTGSLPLTLAPVATGAVAYPQGATAWFALAQDLFRLPPPRTPLLVTPLFMGLAPLGAFVVGKRWLGDEAGAAALAVMMGLLGPGTRYLAGGSNDFVLAFPLVLLLAARGRDWIGESGPALRDGIGFGALAGYSAALNPVGAEWLFVLLPLLAVPLLRSRLRVGRWLGTWAIAAAAGAIWVLPALLGLARGVGTPAGTATFRAGAFVSLTDPFVVRSTVITFSPFPFLSVELAGLLVAGAIVLVVGTQRPSSPTGWFARFALAGVASGLLWIGLGALATDGTPGLGALLAVTSLGEMSILLFAVFAFIAAVPLALLFREAAPATSTSGEARVAGSRVRRRPRLRSPPGERQILAAGLALVLLVPGGVITGTELPTFLDSVYHSFSNVTTADYDLLAWAGQHLPAGARVLVAPGSAAQFLPGYLPSVVLLFPMTGPSWRSDPSYLELNRLLANGTLGTNGTRDLAALDVEFVAVTGNSTVLYPAFSPAPFRSSAGFSLLFQEGDAYLFSRSAAG